MRPLVLVQARCGSQRLPGKVLRPLAGRPMIAHLLERLGACREVSGVAIATSDIAADDPLAGFAAGAGVPCFRGAHDDVAGRLVAAADAFGAAAFVRISGDSPLLDPALVDRLVRLFRDRAPDLATNIRVRSFPKGQSVEVVDRAVLSRLLPDLDAHEREHVTPRFYARPQDFRIASLESGHAWGAIQLSVDTLEDFRRAERLLAALPDGPEGWRLEATLAALRRLNVPAMPAHAAAFEAEGHPA